MSNGCEKDETQSFDVRLDSTSTSLLERAKLGDRAAWARLVDLYGPVIYQQCRLTGLSSSDTADIVQEVFVAVLKHLSSFRRDRPGDSFRKWLRTITANAIRDAYRRRKGRPLAQGGSTVQRQLAQIPAASGDAPGEQQPSTAQPADGAEAVLVNRAMERVRGRVKPHNWQAFCAVVLHGRPVGDVAQELGIPARSVYDAKYRVLRMIREELSDLLE